MLEKSTYYILDAQGQQLSMYEHTVDTAEVKYYLAERNIYGSSRLGTTRDTVNMYNPQLLPSYGILGNRNYELNNHLGNVLTVITDEIIPLDEDLDEEVDGYQVSIRNTYDYSPFGVHLDGRTIEKMIEVCTEVSDTTIINVMNETFDSAGSWTSTGVGTLSYPSGTLMRSIPRTSSGGTMSAHKTFTTGEGLHTITFDIVQNSCGQWMQIFGGGMMWVTSPLYVRILDQYDNVVASNSYTTNGSYSLSFTPSTSGSTYKIQLYMPNAVSQCMYSLDNISISYYEVDTDIVCENVPLGYRYGFNGMEKDDEAKGKGNSYDFGARMFDPRIGRWLSRDKKEYKMPDHSPYVFVNNDPIRYIDPDGNFLIDVHKRIMRKAFKRSKLGESVEYTHVDVGIYRRTLVGTGGQITHSPKVRHHGSVIEPDVKSLPKVMGGGGQESIDEEHFDNMNSSQIQKNYNDVYSSMIAAVDSYSAGEIDAHELGNKVGPYFHALQDLYSHSNYIELYEEMYGKTDVNLIPTYGEVLSESKYADFKQLLTDKLHSGHYPGKGEGSHREMNHDLGEGSAFDFLPEVKDKKVNWNSKAAEAVATKSSTYMNDIIEGKMTQKK